MGPTESILRYGMDPWIDSGTFRVYWVMDPWFLTGLPWIQKRVRHAQRLIWWRYVSSSVLAVMRSASPRQLMPTQKPRALMEHKPWFLYRKGYEVPCFCRKRVKRSWSWTLRDSEHIIARVDSFSRQTMYAVQMLHIRSNHVNECRKAKKCDVWHYFGFTGHHSFGSKSKNRYSSLQILVHAELPITTELQ